MLIEIFSDRVFENTAEDPEHGIRSQRAPSTHISEKGPIIDYYLKARDFLIMLLDNQYNCIRNDGSYMLEIEKTNQVTENTFICGSRFINEYEFSFKFNSLRDTMDEDKAYTIHGSIIIDANFNIIDFERDRVKQVDSSNVTTVMTPRLVTDSTSTSGRRFEYIEENNHPFDSGCQQKEPCKDTKGADSNITNGSESIELSENSFSVKGTSINITDPKLKIGTIDGNSFSIDEEKQRKQDEFLANMSRKISKRNRHRGAK